MFFAIFIILILVALVVHELSHGMAMRRYGVEVPEAGLGLPIPRLPSLAIKFSSGFTFRIHPFLLGAYVRPKSSEDIEKLSYQEKAHIYGAGVIANFIMGILIIIPWTIVKLFKYPEEIAANLIVLILLIAAVFVLWRFSKKISAYILPFMGVAMMVYLVWSLAAVGAEESVMGPVGLFTMGMGFVSFYQATIWGAYVSIGFAMMNLLPFLPLDGGRIMTEFLQHKFKAGNSVEMGIKVASAAFFLAIIILVFFTDFSRIA